MFKPYAFKSLSRKRPVYIVSRVTFRWKEKHSAVVLDNSEHFAKLVNEIPKDMTGNENITESVFEENVPD